MKFCFANVLFVLVLTTIAAIPTLQAQKKAPECVKVAKVSRPNTLLLELKDLNNFYRNFSGSADFKEMKIVKSELAYYLIASDRKDVRILAFQLEQNGKKLFLNRKLPVHSCDQGDLTLDTFLQADGYITGCRIGKHSIQQRN